MKTYYLAAFIFIIVFASECKSPTSPQELQNGVQLDKNTVADKFGNNNGVTTTQELQAVADYFASNDSAWCLQVCSLQISDATSISAQQVKDSFVLQSYPYPSEQALRSAYDEIGIETP